MTKERADILVVQQGLTPSREQAKRLIMAGQIYNQNNQRIDKPGEKWARTTQLHIKGEGLPYVSRGGLKLVKALDCFNVSPAGLVVLDIGASTGGFTDVVLQQGALRSYALDVGYNQLDWRIRQDARVVVMERTNFRHCQPADFVHGVPQLAVIDVSFISLRLILPNLATILAAGGTVIALIKPQFEAGREHVGKKGIVRDRAVHRHVLQEICDFAQMSGFRVCGLTHSPITGGTGNIEFLVHLQKEEQAHEAPLSYDWDAIVAAAHQQLYG